MIGVKLLGGEEGLDEEEEKETEVLEFVVDSYVGKGVIMEIVGPGLILEE